MQKYRYTLPDQIVEVATLAEVPKGVKHEVIQYQIADTKNLEISTLREKTEAEIDAFISSHVQKLILRQVEIPVEIMQEYNAMREAYQVEKQLILDK